jgi:hypothetical protein
MLTKPTGVLLQLLQLPPQPRMPHPAHQRTPHKRHQSRQTPVTPPPPPLHPPSPNTSLVPQHNPPHPFQQPHHTCPGQCRLSLRTPLRRSSSAPSRSARVIIVRNRTRTSGRQVRSKGLWVVSIFFSRMGMEVLEWGRRMGSELGLAVVFVLLLVRCVSPCPSLLSASLVVPMPFALCQVCCCSVVGQGMECDMLLLFVIRLVKCFRISDFLITCFLLTTPV